MMAKNQIQRFNKANAKRMVTSARRSYNLVKTKTEPHLPNIGNILLSMGGGATAGVVLSGVTPIPTEIAGVSSPLIIGAGLAGYAIYSNSQKGSSPMVANTAMKLGSAMLAVYASDMVQDVIEKNQQSKIGA